MAQRSADDQPNGHVSGSLRAEMEMHIAALDIVASLCAHDLAALAIQRRQ